MQESKHLYKSIIFVIFIFAATNIKGKSLAFFSPDDQPQVKLINMINQTNYKIKVAIYLLTDKTIANSLIEAKKRGVHIEIITDQSTITSPITKINLLKENAIDIFTFKSLKTKNTKWGQPLMHNKFAIFELQDKPLNKKANQWVWTGSFNWTQSGNKQNQENVILTNSQNVFKKYNQQFETIKKRCICKTSQTKKKKYKKQKPFIKKIKSLFYSKK